MAAILCGIADVHAAPSPDTRRRPAPRGRSEVDTASVLFPIAV